MKKLALMTVNTSLSYLFGSLLVMASIGAVGPVHAAEFFCSSGDVTCLIAKINRANGMPGQHTINLEPGSYTLQAIDNGANGLPVISGSIRIQATADDPPTVVERDPNAPVFRIFQVSVGGELTLDGLTIQRGGGDIIGSVLGPGILNSGTTTLLNSIVADNVGEFGGAITNSGNLNVMRSIITDNSNLFLAGGILNRPGGSVLVEGSTIAHNGADGSGGISNEGALVVRNSSIIFNTAGGSGGGAGIGNGGYLEIVNTTIAKNSVTPRLFGSGGGAISNGGFASIANSTIRENQVTTLFGGGGPGGGISNSGGTVRLQNTIVAGNTVIGGAGTVGPDCFGTITSVGNNLIGDPTDCAINLQPTDLTGDPGLGSLVGAGEDDLPGKAFYPVLAGSAVIDRANPAACLQTDQLGLLRVGVCDMGTVEFRGPMLVSVDVRPRSDANRINPNSTKNINVAIFSVNGFDATTVNVSTVRFGATGTEAAPINVALRDVDGDGDLDMLLRFEIQDTGIKCGDTSAILTGQISNGPSIIGSSPIQTVQCGKQNNSKISAKLK